MSYLDAELGEGAIEEGELLHRTVPHRDFATGDGPHGQEGGHLVEVIGKGEFGTRQPIDPLHHDPRAADAFDAGAHQGEEGAELLHMGFAGGVGQLRASRSRGCAEDEVLGRGHRGVVEPVVRGPKAAGGGDVEGVGLAVDLGPEGLEDLDVGVDLPGAQGAACCVLLDGRRAEPVEQGRDQHQGRAHAQGQVRRLGIEPLAVPYLQHAGLEVHLHARAEAAEEIEDLPDVGDVRHPVQGDRLVGQEGGAEYRQDGVLVG